MDAPGGEKGDEDRLPGPKKAGGGKSPPAQRTQPQEPRDRGFRRDNPLPPPEDPGVNPIWILPVAGLPRLAPALPRVLPSIGGWVGGVGRGAWGVAGGIGRGIGGTVGAIGGRLVSPIIIFVDIDPVTGKPRHGGPEA